jgi:hypothetical protein
VTFEKIATVYLEPFTPILLPPCVLQNVPDEILRNVSDQIRQVMPVPIRLDQYSQEDRELFPRVVEL